MTPITLQEPDELALRLKDIAAAERKSVERLAVERLQRFVSGGSGPRVGIA